MDADAAARTEAYLLAAATPDGGWGYAPSGSALVEPTALCTLALAGASPAAAGPRQRGLDWLCTVQHADGGWGIGRDDPTSGWMTGPAVWALAAGLGAEHPTVRAGVAWLEAARLAPADPGAENGEARGWAWADTPVPWVEPTALAVLALCAAGARDSAAVAQGTRFLLMRALAGGGWNLGDPGIGAEVPDPDLHPTALALLALEAAGTAEAGSGPTRAGIQALATLAPTAVSALALGWAALALARLGVDPRLDRDLVARRRSDGAWEGTIAATAVALLALQAAVPGGPERLGGGG